MLQRTDLIYISSSNVVSIYQFQSQFSFISIIIMIFLLPFYSPPADMDRDDINEAKNMFNHKNKAIF